MYNLFYPVRTCKKKRVHITFIQDDRDGKKISDDLTATPGKEKSIIRDDRIFIEVRLIAAFIIVILLIASVILYIFPANTDIWFSWTVKPLVMPMLMGGGYFAGAFFFFRVLTSRSWHQVQQGFLPITAFTILMLLTTVLHWDKFYHGTVAFYSWTAIYAITPFLVPFLWWRNRATDPNRREAGEYYISLRARWILTLVSVAGLIASLLFFAFPALFISFSPWMLTPLTARVGAGWALLTACTVLSIASDPRWSAARNLVEAGMIGVALMFLAFLRAWTDLDPANPSTWIFLTTFVLLFLGFGVVHLKLDAPLGQKTTS